MNPVVDIKLNDKKVRVIGNGIVNIHKVLPNVDLSTLHFKEEVKNLLPENYDSLDEKGKEEAKAAAEAEKQRIKMEKKLAKKAGKDESSDK